MAVSAVSSGKRWVTVLAREPPNGGSIKVVDNLIPSLRSLLWLHAVSFLSSLTLLS